MDWSALGGNPVPGSVLAVQDMACLMRDIQRDAESALDRLLVIQDQAGEGIWTGVAADEFRADLAGVLPDLRRLAQSHGDAGRALTDYAQKLEDAQGLARDAAHAATVAVERRNRADHDIGEAGQDVRRREGRLFQLNGDLGRVTLQLTQSQAVGDLATQMRLAEEMEQIRRMRSSVTQALAAARARREAAERARATAEAHLAAARRLAEQAVSIRTDGGRHVAHRINQAAEVNIAGKPWYEEFADAVVDTVKKIASSPAFSQFLSALDSLSDLVFIIGTVAAVVVAIATLNPALGFAVFKVATAVSKGIDLLALAGKTLAWSVGAKPGKDLLWAAVGVFLPGDAKRVVKWGGMIKRAINVTDARRVTGFFRQFHAAPRPPIGAEPYFRIVTGVQISTDALDMADMAATLFGNPVELTTEITSSLDNLGQYQEAEKLFEDMGIQR